MADRLKDQFAEDVPHKLASMISAVHRDFPAKAFVTDALDGYDELELTQRARRIAGALSSHLPEDRREALKIVVDSLGPPIDDADDLGGMASFLYLPYVYFVAAEGLGHFEEAMQAQYEITKRFTAEFSIRSFLEHDPERTLERLSTWATDPDPHVRRLVSEGTRPRLPWAPRLREFMLDPAPVITLLDRLFDDESTYVRRSVANNLNDISKDHPHLAIATARRWSEAGADSFVIRHGLRTLVKQGHPDALRVLGFDHGSPVEVEVECRPGRVPIGGKTRITVVVSNPTESQLDVVVDLAVHFVKRSGSASPKVFKGRELRLGPHATSRFTKSVSAAVHTTRQPHPGVHVVDALVNGERRSHLARFEIIPAPEG